MRRRHCRAGAERTGTHGPPREEHPVVVR